jgi:hypothetical protein
MSVNERTRFILGVISGNQCAFPGCDATIIANDESLHHVILGEVAHIRAQSPGGPRFDKNYPKDKVDAFENLIYLCERHHKIVDNEFEKYPVEWLEYHKKLHEDKVSKRDDNNLEYTGQIDECDYVKDILYSTMMNISRIPVNVYMAVLLIPEREVKAKIQLPLQSDFVCPFIAKENKLFTFTNISDYEDMFKDVVDIGTVEKHDAKSWWVDPDMSKWYMDLLRRTLNKITGRKGLHLDKDHDRYFFTPNDDGSAKEISYISITGRKAKRSVAWNPKFRFKEGSRKHWEHLAVHLEFHNVDHNSWCLSLRPERRFTYDGITPVQPKGTGRRATRKKSRMYNIDLLEEVHFWREYLTGGNPRLVVNFGGQQKMIIENELIMPTISWPGIQKDNKAVKHEIHGEDLFSMSELEQITEEDEVDGYELTEFEDFDE